MGLDDPGRGHLVRELHGVVDHLDPLLVLGAGALWWLVQGLRLHAGELEEGRAGEEVPLVALKVEVLRYLPGQLLK